MMSGNSISGNGVCLRFQSRIEIGNQASCNTDEDHASSVWKIREKRKDRWNKIRRIEHQMKRSLADANKMQIHLQTEEVKADIQFKFQEQDVDATESSLPEHGQDEFRYSNELAVLLNHLYR